MYLKYYPLLLFVALFSFLALPSGATHLYRSYILSHLSATKALEGVSRDTVPTVGDLNGDGRLDLVLADPTERGQIYVYTDFSISGKSSYTFRIDGKKEREPVGSFSGIADANKDGVQDILVGREDRRSAYYIPGPIQSPERGRILRLDRRNRVDFPGVFLALRDLDGNDLPELIVLEDDGRIGVYREMSSLWFRLEGLSGSVEGSGIFSDGGRLVLGDPGFGKDGTVFYLPLPEDEGVVINVLQNGLVHRIISPWEKVGFGGSVAMWDMNGDGELDLLVSTRDGRRWGGMFGPIAAGKKMDFEVQDAPPKFWIADFDQNGMNELFFGPPLRWMANRPPELEIVRAEQKENGWVHIQLNLVDPDGGEADISMEYMTKGGFVRASEAHIRGSSSVGLGKGRILEWDASGDFPDQYLEEEFEYQLLVEDNHFMYSTALVQGTPITVDTLSPSIQLSPPEFREDGKVVIAGRTSDNSPIQSVRFRVDGGDWQQAIATYPPWGEMEEEFEISFPGKDRAKYSVTVESTDAHGNKSPVTDSTHFRVEVPSNAFGLLSEIHPNQEGASANVSVALFPNPYSVSSNTPITIQYGLAADADVKVFVYSIGGTMAWQQSFIPGEEGGKRGPNTVLWDGRNSYGSSISSGIYAVKVISGGRLHSGSRLIIVN